MISMMEKIKNCRRVAVMGGTFDPIHYGHLAAAETVRQAYETDCVLFIPAGQPPHKDNARVTPGEHRYAMAMLATAEHPSFEVSRMEIDRTGPSYTIDTVRALRDACPATEFLYITGADAIEQILTWKEAPTLLTLCPFVVVTRPGFDKEAVLRYRDELQRLYTVQLPLLDIPGVAVSGTDLRERVAAGLPIRYLLPPTVEHYIRRHALYTSKIIASNGNSPVLTEADEIERQLFHRLSSERFAHTIGVMKEAVKLAKHYGADTTQARIAALLHDCAKEYSPDKKRVLCRMYGIKTDAIMEKQIDLTHSLLSAEAACYEYGVDDPAVLQAIRFHTTGHKGMTLLDKIIMLADYIEPTREDYAGLTEMRALAYTDLDGALRIGIKQAIAYCKKRKRLIHPWSRDALKEVRKKKKRSD